jgi:hypothetical protein
MADLFFVNEAIVVDQNTAVYGEVPVVDETAYDYILDIDIGSNTLNDLFSTRVFLQNSAEQNTAGENTYDVNLLINNDFVSAVLGGNNVDLSSQMTDVTGKAAYSTIDSSASQQLGLRLLEVMATKIFGHARARAAISNDTAFYEIKSRLAEALHDAVANKRNDIFNQYVQYDRIEENTGNDVTANGVFNFKATRFEIPLFLNGAMESSLSAPADLLNGPDVGGEQVINGVYNIPMLLKFNESS